MAKIIRELMGYSKSEVKLMEDNGKIFVRKSGDISRNLERFDALERIGLPTPKILEITGQYYDMEYIPNLDVVNYFTTNQIWDLSDFIVQVLEKLSENSIEADFSKVYFNKLEHFSFGAYNLPFTADELIAKLPKFLPMSEYHGDFTLQNILFNASTKKFVLIDPLTTDYSSYVFDIAKLRQDLTCKWFVRQGGYFFDSKLKMIHEALSKFTHYNNDYLLILMLIRVIPYCDTVNDQNYLRNEILKLWK